MKIRKKLIVGFTANILVSGVMDDKVVFVVRGNTAKLANLRRDPRCSLLVSQEDWRGYVVLEGRAELLSPETTDAVELRETLRDVYRVASGTEHSNWQEYDAAMLEQRRSSRRVVKQSGYSAPSF